MFISSLVKKSSDRRFFKSTVCWMFFFFPHPKKRLTLNMLLYQMLDFNLDVTILPLSSWTQLFYKHCIFHIEQKLDFQPVIRTEGYY